MQRLKTRSCDYFERRKKGQLTDLKATTKTLSDSERTAPMNLVDYNHVVAMRHNESYGTSPGISIVSMRRAGRSGTKKDADH